MDITIVVFCLILLTAYLFDLTSSKTKIPSVVFLLFLGWLGRLLADFSNVRLSFLATFLPLLGTIGLILIVLEGSLELELNKSKLTVIKKSLLGASMTLIISSLLIAFIFNYFGYTFRESLINAIPLCIISSAVAIPSVKDLSYSQKEFVIYESSLSDIIGVLLFNFVAINNKVTIYSLGHFGFQIGIIVIISTVATLGLSLLLSRLEHPAKFIPITLLVILIYAISKSYHLPGLLFILMFGLFIGNFDELRQFQWTKRFKPIELDKEVQKFKEITIEGAFLIRSIFFILFGYFIEKDEVLNLETAVLAFALVGIIFLIRFIQLKLSRLPLMPLLFIAPRGLITILLFLSITSDQYISLVNRSLITQIIVITALLMTIGLMVTRKKHPVI